MSSRPIRRSPPLIRWKNLSSSDHRASPVRKSFEQEKFSGISHHYEDGHSSDRPPYYPAASRSKYQFSTLSMDYRQRDHPSIGSRNLKTASRSYWRHPQYNAARTFLPRKRYSPVVKSSADADHELRSLKRVRSHEDLSDNFPFKWSKQQIDRRYDSHHSRCPPEYKSGDRWQSPPCRRSKEIYRDVSQNYEYDRVHISRDSATNMRKKSENSRRTSNNHSDKEQCSTSGKRQFSDDALDKYYKDKKTSKDDVLQGLKRDSSSNLDLDHDDRKLFGHLNRNREKIMESTRQSPLLYRQNSKGKVPPEKRAQYLPGKIEAQSINPKRKRESLSEANTRQKDGTDEMQAQNRHSKDLTKLTNCSKVKSSDENDLLWTASGNRSSRQSLSSASNSSYNSSQVSTTARSRESSESKGSRDLNADIHTKAKVLEFNPDYVVIVRRHNEGERPLCSREEFSETVLKPVSDSKQDSERKNAPSPDKAPAFENVSLKPEDETAPHESSSAYKDSPVSFQKEKSVDVKIAGDLSEKPSSCDRSSTSVSDSSIVSAKRRDERIVTSERTTSLNNSSGTNLQNAELVSDAEEEPSMLKKKNPFDLRQRIAERRLLRTGKVNISRTVRQFPNQSKNINEPFIHVSSMETCQNQSYAQRQIFNRHPFYRRKPAPRRSVILRQSH